MKIEFFDKETGEDFELPENIGWRVVEEVKEIKEQELIVDWSKIDRIYKWVAMNQWGDLSSFMIKPKLSEYDGQWYTPVGFYVGSVDDCVISRPSPDKWRESLIQRPEGV